MFFDINYLIFMIPAFILMGITSWYVRHAYSKWSRIRASSGLTGVDATRRLISINGLTGLQIQGTPGELTDHYDPRNNTLFLSNSVANVPSVAALAIAAHELGHAQQDAEEYFPMRLRGFLVPMVNIGSNLGWILILAGLLLNLTGLAWVGVLVFSGGALFALATLPVEFDASARAKRMLANSGIIQTEEEMRGINSVLNAAALTYVAGLVTAILQLLYYVSLVSGRSRD
ncbi:MAG TPA: zinc metallopeptidase [Anaerolineae bacterium]|nr:zinc metallopeptidase [Anaerolineae bacterium]HRJ76640.1 zinc metallopeptidase [Anaerolineales bacterium]